MNDRLATLDDPTALALLTAYATPRLRHDGLQASLTADLRAALASAYGTSSAAPSEGDLARATLAFLASDPATAAILDQLLDGPQAVHFAKPAGNKIAVTVAVLLALQTHLRIERDAAGEWRFLLDKPTASEELLAPVVQKLVGLPGVGSK
jgi:hypothetical protein